MAHKARLGALTILNGQTDSNLLSARELAMAIAVVFYNPAAFTGVVAVKVAPRDDSLAAAHLPLDNNGAAVVLTAGRAQRHDVNGFESIMLTSGLAEGADRVVEVFAILDI